MCSLIVGRRAGGVPGSTTVSLLSLFSSSNAFAMLQLVAEDRSLLVDTVRDDSAYVFNC